MVQLYLSKSHKSKNRDSFYPKETMVYFAIKPITIFQWTCCHQLFEIRVRFDSYWVKESPSRDYGANTWIGLKNNSILNQSDLSYT